MWRESKKMQADIFKLFKKSIEQVQVKRAPRGTLEPETEVFDVTIDAIVKRRELMADSVENSEDYANNTTVHFRQKDAEYIAVGNYVNIDGSWHSILQVRDGKDFSRGKSRFIRVFLDNDVVKFDADPVWS